MTPLHLECRVEPIGTSHSLEFELCIQLVLTTESIRIQGILGNILPIADMEALASSTPAGIRNKEIGPETESVDQDIRFGRPT